MSAEPALNNDPSDEVAWLPNGTAFGKYTIVRPLGAGGMGQVYEGVHTALNKRVAIKTLHRSMASLPEVTARFIQEAESIAKIDHPNVVGVIDTGVEHEMPYIVMDFLEGESLASRIDRERKMDVSEAVEIVLGVIAGVMDAHAVGIIHRDLKPDNVFLTRDRRGRIVPKVVDFGIARLVEEGQARAKTQTSAVIGTVQYLAPELLDGAKNAGPASDQYAIGAVLYECLTGQCVIDGDSMIEMISSIARSLYKRPIELRPELSPELDAIIMQTLEPRPAARFRSLLVLGEALFAFASDEGQAIWAGDFGHGPAVAPRTSVVARVSQLDAAPVSRAPTEIERAPTAHAVAARSRTPIFIAAAFGVILVGGAVALKVMSSGPSTTVRTEDHTQGVVPPVALTDVAAVNAAQTEAHEQDAASVSGVIAQSTEVDASAPTTQAVISVRNTNPNGGRNTHNTVANGRNGSQQTSTATATNTQTTTQTNTPQSTGTHNTAIREGANAAPIIH